MKQAVTKGIILARTNYGEADRIITVITPDYGKLRLMAKGVRRQKSKLAGGIELFSVSDITFIKGKRDIGTLVSARLDIHFRAIVRDIDRTMLGYELMKQLHRATEDETEAEYFYLLEKGLRALDTEHINSELIRLWFTAQLLKFGGHTPNMQTDTTGQALSVDKGYNFSFEDMAFEEAGKTGRFDANCIKVMRLLFSHNSPGTLCNVQGIESQCSQLVPVVNTMKSTHIMA